VQDYEEILVNGTSFKRTKAFQREGHFRRKPVYHQTG
jgi:hypothetical protein